jgi:hypothetical protein
MREELLETEAIEVPADDDVEAEQPTARPLPATRDEAGDLSTWRGEVRNAALAAAGGLVAGAATVAVVRASRSVAGGRKPAKRPRTKERPVKVVASRSFMVDVHLLGDR